MQPLRQNPQNRRPFRQPLALLLWLENKLRHHFRQMTHQCRTQRRQFQWHM
jgi:hypothetical protein